MKKLFFAIVAMFLLMGVNSNVIAQNPVKKVKYLKHVFEGEVNKKVPEGKGTMFFDGFTVQGDFQGNEVTNATLSIDNSDITYNGSLSFDESQNVTLKHGGEIKTFLYTRTNHNWSGETTFSEYTPYVIETISTDKNVSINFFNKSELDFQYTVSVDWKDKIKEFFNPPVITQTFHKKATKTQVLVRYDGNEIEEFKGEPYNPLVCKLKTVFILEDIPEKYLTKVNEYKDEKGRSWNVDGNDVSIKDEKGRSWSFFGNGMYVKSPLSNGITVNYNSSKPEIEEYVFCDSNNTKIASWKVKYDNKDLNKRLQETTEKILKWPHEIDLHNCGNLSDNEIEQLLRTHIFPNLNGEQTPYEASTGSYADQMLLALNETADEKMGRKSNYNYILINYNSTSAKYYYDNDTFISENQIKEEEKRKEEDKEIHDLEVAKKLLDEINPFIKRFGFNPLKRGLKDIVKVGTSFKLISDYFKLTEKYFYCFRGKGESFKRVFPGEEFVDLMGGKLNELAIERNFIEKYSFTFFQEGYYYIRLSIDHGTRKCYDIRYIDVFDRVEKIGFVWVSGDKITSVVW